MLQRLRRFEGLDVHARDGEVGRISDLYLDRHRWVGRYLVVRTGGWLGRDVLISPVTADHPDWRHMRLDLGLTQAQVRDSPDLLSGGPLTRSGEEAHAAYFGYAGYWGGPGLWGWAGYPGALATPPPIGYPLPAAAQPEEVNGLHPATELRGMHLEARDGEIGHVDDALIDDVSWQMRYLLVDTSNWIGGRSVLVPVAAMIGDPWTERVVRVRISRAAVRTAPEVDPDVPLENPDESALERHYDARPLTPAAGAGARSRSRG